MTIVRCIIGRTTGSTGPSPQGIGTMATTSRYYDDVRSYLMALAGLIHMLEIGNGISIPYRPDDSIRIDCGLEAAAWYWKPEQAVVSLAHNMVPLQLNLGRFATSGGAGSGPISLGAIGTMLEAFGQVLASNYFERHRSAIEAKFGDEPATQWPSVWNFARVVRNAMSHKGIINIKNPNAHAVTWKSLRYSHADNGKAILHVDLWPGDLIDLLVELDQHVS